MRGSVAKPLRGSRELSTRLLDQAVEVGALGFLQPNPAAAELAYAALTELSASMPRQRAFDLYAGAGVTTRRLRAHFAEVLACEAYPESAAALGVAPETAEAFVQRALRGETGSPDLVIANPPRKGMGALVCGALVSLAAPELRIMSCGPAGLARDLADLSPAYTLVGLRAFDTLPQTPHVELVAILRARGGAERGDS
jgi:tRNA/tmRNA/rRNA uracil-C5-methylase (TrmA/RlmC/RlmD family)